jgi:hypothetical protein
VQAATGDAIVDCIAEGILPKDQLNRLCMIIMVWLDPRCATHAELDKKDPIAPLRSDEARDLSRHEGRADGRRAHRQPQKRPALRA